MTRRAPRTRQTRRGAVQLVCGGVDQNGLPCGRTIDVVDDDLMPYRPRSTQHTPRVAVRPLPEPPPRPKSPPPAPAVTRPRRRVVVEVDPEMAARMSAVTAPIREALAGKMAAIASATERIVGKMQAWDFPDVGKISSIDIPPLRQAAHVYSCSCGFSRPLTAEQLLDLMYDAHDRGERRVTL